LAEGVRRRREEQRAETRERLLKAAGEVFAERGFYGASVEEITERAGFTRGAFYSNFETKADLFLAVLDAHIARERQVVADLLTEDPSANAFMKLLNSRTAEVRESGESQRWALLWAEFWLHVMRHPELAPKLAERQAGVRAGIAALLERQCAAYGITLPMPAEHLAAVMLAVDDGLRLQESLDPEAVPPELRANMLIFLFQGLVAAARK
jgi:AcrR family transcriptional regulator